MSVSIEISDLSKSFASTRAIDNVTLSIEPGELFFFLGPSGCGKTTLLRCVAGFTEPDNGRVMIGDRDVTRLPPHRRDTGMVFQSYALWPHMNVARNVGFGLEMRRMTRAEISRRVAEALDMVRMSDRAHHKPNQLSGGQQQRVALARALVIRPQCLLLDEPLSNLDARLRLDMRSEIRRICKGAGLTTLYVTHDQKEALSMADRMAVLDEGSVRQVGTPRDVYLRPASRFVAGFVGETNFLPGTVTTVTADSCRVQTPIGEITGTPPLHSRFPPGPPVTLSMRPEVIRLDPSPADSPNVFRGVLHDTVYLGEVAQHQLNIPAVDSASTADTVLKVFELNPRILARDTRKDVNAWIAPENVVVLADT